MDAVDGHRRIIAIDPGTRCGWAIQHHHGAVESGEWVLRRNAQIEGFGMLGVRVREGLTQLEHKIGKPDIVAFEQVSAHKGSRAAHVYGAVIGAITAWCERHNAPYVGVHVTRIKKLATGRGNAGKQAMIEAALEKWPYQMGRVAKCETMTDNQADALWIMEAVRGGVDLL